MIKYNKVSQFKRLARVQGQGNACGKVQEVRMTYIEFFDKNASENICACLSCAPDRVILLGEISDEGDSQGERAAKMATALTSSPQRFLAK